jgi:hypothetical protein
LSGNVPVSVAGVAGLYLASRDNSRGASEESSDIEGQRRIVMAALFDHGKGCRPPLSPRSMPMSNFNPEGTSTGSGPMNPGPGSTEGTWETFEAARPTLSDERGDDGKEVVIELCAP